MQYLIGVLRLIIYLVFMAILMWVLIKPLFLGIFRKKFFLTPRNYVKRGLVTSVFMIMAQVVLWKVSNVFLTRNNPFQHNFKYVVITMLFFAAFYIISFIIQNLHHLKVFELHKWRLTGLLLDFLIILSLSLIMIRNLNLKFLIMNQWSSLIDSILFIMIMLWLVIMDECIFQSWLHKFQTSK